MENDIKYWALSYGVQPSELFANFFKKHSLSITSSEVPDSKHLIRNYMSCLFSHFMYLVIMDVIENLTIFKFPAPRRCYIEMDEVTGDNFKLGYSRGAYLDIDFLATNFTGYDVNFRMSTRYGKWIKRIYVTRDYKSRIAEKANRGEKLTSHKQVLLEDYIDRVLELFPVFPKKDIKKILHYGLVMYALANRYRCDIVFYKKYSYPSMSLVTGVLFKDKLKNYQRFLIKWRMKERFLYRITGKQWDGYYYIGLPENKHQELLKQTKQKKVLKDVYFCKIKKELYHNKIFLHIWRVPWPKDMGWKFYLDIFKSDKWEYVGPNKYELYHQCFLGKFKDYN